MSARPSVKKWLVSTILRAASCIDAVRRSSSNNCRQKERLCLGDTSKAVSRAVTTTVSSQVLRSMASLRNVGP